METKTEYEIKNDLEYNDGLGDLLREKEKLEFSWIKTSTVFIILLAIIIGASSFLLNSGKKFIANQADKTIPIVDTAITTTTIESTSVETTNDIKAIKPTQTEPTPQVTNTGQTSNVLPTATSITFKVISGAYFNKSLATAQLKQINALGYQSFLKQTQSKDGRPLYKIQVGAFTSRSSAENLKVELTSKGFDSYLTTL